MCQRCGHIATMPAAAARRNKSLIVTWLISLLRSLRDETGNLNPKKEGEMANLWLEISKSWL